MRWAEQHLSRTPAALLEPYELRSGIPRQSDFDHPNFELWMDRIGKAPAYDRKLWEYMQVLEAGRQFGFLADGQRGISFGSGLEPLSSFFAASGCDVLVTDIEPATQRLRDHWIATGQHCGGDVGKCRVDSVCDEETFKARVSFKYCDMRKLPTNLKNFDFCWSLGSFEHLGSAEAGVEFVLQSLCVLRSGGVAIHTTEYSFEPPNDRIDITDTIYYGLNDLRRLVKRLESMHHKVCPLKLEPGDGFLDSLVLDCSVIEPHVNIRQDGRVSTSASLIIVRS